MKRRRDQSTSSTEKGHPADRNEDENELTFLEYYAGIGGWRMALHQALDRMKEKNSHINTRCVAALDHSDLCVNVYQHNFPKDSQSVRTTAIEKITLKQLSTILKASMWFASPPCQPHTRQHTNQAQERQDPRSQSFQHMIDLLEKLEEGHLPRIIALENVMGFEVSESCQLFRDVLHKRSYRIAEFINLSPTQVLLPNDRPRYFCVAIRIFPDQVLALNSQQSLLLTKYFSHDSKGSSDDTSRFHASIPEFDVTEENTTISSDGGTLMPSLKDFLDSTTNISPESSFDLNIPNKILERTSAWCFDIVTPSSTRTACFTSGYGRFIRGTGSILYTGDLPSENNTLVLAKPEDRSFDDNEWLSKLEPQKLRYFSGLEMSRLFGFDDNFSFPSNCTLKQQWKLVGNSLNSRLAARLIELALNIMQPHLLESNTNNESN